jgi:acyl-coenzyme A thioesterase PaaI-like protein
VSSSAFQDLIHDNFCFGCGADNPDGLQIKSVWVGPAESVCVFRPRPHQSAGPRHVLNGGIIATLIDCHSVCTAVADAYRREGREIGSDPPLWCVTGRMTVAYLKPTPIDRPVELRARVEEVDGRKTRLSCNLSSDGEVTARGDVLAIQVAAVWRQGG